MRSFSPEISWTCILTTLHFLQLTANGNHEPTISSAIDGAGTTIKGTHPTSVDDVKEYDANVKKYGKEIADDLQNVRMMARMDRKSFREAFIKRLHEQMWPTGVQRRADSCPECPSGWAGYKDCTEQQRDAEQSYEELRDVTDNTAKAAASLLGVADVPLICDCGSTAGALVIDGLELERKSEAFFSVKCVPEARQAKWKMQEALAKTKETRESVNRDYEKLMEQKRIYFNITDKALTDVEDRLKGVNSQMADILEDLKKIDVLQNTMDNITEKMTIEFLSTNELLDESTEAIMNTVDVVSARETFANIYYKYKVDVRFKLQDTFEKFIDVRNIEDEDDLVLEWQNLHKHCETLKIQDVIKNMNIYFKPAMVFKNDPGYDANTVTELLPQVLSLIDNNLNGFSQFVLDIMNDVTHARIVFRQCADMLWKPVTEETVYRPAVDKTIENVKKSLSRAIYSFQDRYLPPNGNFTMDVELLKEQVNGYFEANQLSPALERFKKSRGRNIVVFRTAVVNMPCPSKDTCDKDVVANAKQWIRILEDRDAHKIDNASYVAIMDGNTTCGKENKDGAAPVFAVFARPSFVNTNHTKDVDEAVKNCHKNLTEELENVFFRYSPIMAEYDPKLKSVVSLETFLEAGHRILNFTVEKSDGYLKIAANKEKKSVFNCPDDYPVRPLAVFYGVSDSEKKWYAGESRHFYPEPFPSQVMIPDSNGLDQLIDIFFHAIVFY